MLVIPSVVCIKDVVFMAISESASRWFVIGQGKELLESVAFSAHHHHARVVEGYDGPQGSHGIIGAKKRRSKSTRL